MRAKISPCIPPVSDFCAVYAVVGAVLRAIDTYVPTSLNAREPVGGYSNMTQTPQNTAFPGNLFQSEVQGIDLSNQAAALALTKVPGRSLGIGLSGIAEYSTELPFLNLFKSNSGWTPHNGTTWDWDTGESNLLNLDSEGWLRSIPKPEDPPLYNQVGTLLLRAIPGTFPSGRYVVTYQGEGTINYGFDATKIANLSRPGRDILQVDNSSGGGIYIQVTDSDPRKSGNYLRDIEVYREEDLPLVELGIKFNPVWLQKFKQFGSLRFMDWMGTNNSTQKNWSDRPTIGDYSWSKKGVPVEVMVELANETGMSPWFNMPHDASDDYIRQFATYVRDHLDPSLIATVEYSNEVWNWLFNQAQYAYQKSIERWGKIGTGWVEWYGMRTAQVAKIWKDVFSKQQERVNAVIGVQTAWRGLANYILETPSWVAEGNQPAWKYVDSLAISGYFSGSLGQPENAATVRSWLKDPDGGFAKAFQQLRSGGLLPTDELSLDDTIKDFQHYKQVADQHGLDLVVYEGGSHVVAAESLKSDPALVEFFQALNRRPEMGDLYREMLDAWKLAGGKEFNHFVDVGAPSKHGSWGALESLNQNGSPKYNALTQFIADNDRWWNAPTPNSTIGLYLRGDKSNNSLNGSKDNDILLGGEGDDVITAGEGKDRLHGESGNDSINGDAGDDRIIGALGNDTVKGGLGQDTISTEEGNDYIWGAQGNDSIDGGSGNDLLIGGTGRDTLIGGSGNDRIQGVGPELGKHTIDLLSGGQGKDVFVLGIRGASFYDDGMGGSSGTRDYAVITDFKSTEDRIQLRGSSTNYRLGQSPFKDLSGTAIYLKGNSQELVAIVEGTNLWHLNAAYFNYV